MAIPSSRIIELVIPDETETSENVRDRLEWTWGLGHDHLDDHLQQFSDPQGLLTNETVLMIPNNKIIDALLCRDIGGKMGVRRPYIQKLYNDCDSFEYLMLSIDPANSIPPRLSTSQLPPHLALCTTFGKMMKAWGSLSAADWTAHCGSLVERAKAVAHNDRPVLSSHNLSTMQHVYNNCSWAEYVPSSFLSADSDQTMVEPEDDEPSSPKRKSAEVNWDALSSVSRREPKRRLLCVELESDADSAREGSISEDSHFTGIEDDTQAFVKASTARGDYEVDRRWLKTMRSWLAGSSDADADEALFSAGEVDDSQEQPRLLATLDLEKPDYLSRSRTMS
ncbi:hypothetical protein R3P38DRAFT_2899210 [Favolaschia claudopus]|uniref:Uncharacterized protein n=1 Tax=Favolaschia claudopus TaxID=2862362 RepID=A0AAW0CH09_9AGAR